MKKLTILIATIVATLTVNAAEFYERGEFTVGGFGTVTTADFNNERLGYGTEVSYFLTENIGVGGEVYTDRLDDKVSAGGNLIYRIPVKKAAPYLFAGGGYNWRSETPNISVGAGIEHRFTPNIGAFVDARLLKDVEGEDTASQALVRVGIRIAIK